MSGLTYKKFQLQEYLISPIFNNESRNCGATVRFPDMSSRFAECCTDLDPHSDMVHFFSSYISKWCLRDANGMGSQPWCYISLSRHIIQVCKMLHLSGCTFRHGALFSSYICKWWLLHVQSGHMKNSFLNSATYNNI